LTDIKINPERCKGCGFCVIACPIKNIRMSSKLNKMGYNYAEVTDKEKCTGCGICFKMCPDLCIKIR